MSKQLKGEWFTDASHPFLDIAHMLMKLDDKVRIPDDMRKAIHQHAVNNIGTLPLSIAAVAASMAAAATESGFGLEANNVEHAAYGIQALAEQLHGWNELAYCFGPENTASKLGARHV
jgi:hypothetical protein